MERVTWLVVGMLCVTTGYTGAKGGSGSNGSFLPRSAIASIASSMLTVILCPKRLKRVINTGKLQNYDFPRSGYWR